MLLLGLDIDLHEYFTVKFLNMLNVDAYIYILMHAVQLCVCMFNLYIEYLVNLNV